MAVFSRIKTWVSNEVLTAADLNGEFNNILNNMDPDGIEDFSNNVSQMQSAADPGGVGTESLATTLAGEIQRLRFVINRIVSGAQWYVSPISNLGTEGIVTESLADESVTTDKIEDLAVTTAKIADGAVTKSKITALGQQISASSSTFSSAAGAYTDITNLSVTITTSGRPVYLALIADGGGNAAEIYFAPTAGTTTNFGFYAILRDGVGVGYYRLGQIINTSGSTQSVRVPVGCINHIDVPAAGTYTYKIQVSAGADTSMYCYYTKLVAFEL